MSNFLGKHPNFVEIRVKKLAQIARTVFSECLIVDPVKRATLKDINAMIESERNRQGTLVQTGRNATRNPNQPNTLPIDPMDTVQPYVPSASSSSTS